MVVSYENISRFVYLDTGACESLCSEVDIPVYDPVVVDNLTALGGQKLPVKGRASVIVNGGSQSTRFDLCVADKALQLPGWCILGLPWMKDNLPIINLQDMTLTTMSGVTFPLLFSDSPAEYALNGMSWSSDGGLSLVEYVTRPVQKVGRELYVFDKARPSKFTHKPVSAAFDSVVRPQTRPCEAKTQPARHHKRAICVSAAMPQHRCVSECEMNDPVTEPSPAGETRHKGSVTGCDNSAGPCCGNIRHPHKCVFEAFLKRTRDLPPHSETLVRLYSNAPPNSILYCERRQAGLSPELATALVKADAFQRVVCLMCNPFPFPLTLPAGVALASLARYEEDAPCRAAPHPANFNPPVAVVYRPDPAAAGPEVRDLPRLFHSPDDPQDFEQWEYLTPASTEPKPTLEEQLTSVDLSHLPDEDKTSVLNLLRKYPSLFETGPCLNSPDYEVRIPLKDPHSPIRVAQFRLPFTASEFVEKEADHLEKMGVIEPSSSAWNFPVIAIKRPQLRPTDALRFRMCIDLRRLNSAVHDTIHFPLPRLDEVFENLNGNVVFTKLDLRDAFHNLKVHEKSRDCLSFTLSRSNRKFRYKKLPFGYKLSPFEWQRFISQTMANIPHSWVYQDDILIASPSKERHFQDVATVLQRLSDNYLRLNVSKSEFFKDSVHYLGHIINASGSKPNPVKVEAISKIKTLTTVKEVKSFIGMGSFYSLYVPNFWMLCEPLVQLVRKDVPWKWTPEREHAFQEIKRRLCATTAMCYFPDLKKRFILDCDASAYGCGSVLQQEHDGHLVPIAFFSALFSPAERKYSATQRELLAIIKSLSHFSSLLLYNPLPFEVRTDHASIKFLQNMSGADAHSRLARWAVFLSRFNFYVSHVKGSSNLVADALSRLPQQLSSRLGVVTRSGAATGSDAQNTPARPGPDDARPGAAPRRARGGSTHEPLGAAAPQIPPADEPAACDVATPSLDDTPVPPLQPIFWNLTELAENQRQDEFCSKIITKLEQDPAAHPCFLLDDQGVLRRVQEGRPVVVPRNARDFVFHLIHEIPMSGHQGPDSSYRIAKHKFWWPNLRKDIGLQVAACEICLRFNRGRVPPVPLVKRPVVPEFFAEVHVDVVGPLKADSAGHRFILTLVDQFTRFLVGIPLPDTEGTTIAKALIRDVFSKFGIPKVMVTDNASNLVYGALETCCKFMGIRQLRILAYCAFQNGVLERTHLDLIKAVAKSTDLNQSNWSDMVHLSVLCHNSCINRSLNETPFFCVFLRDGHFPTANMFEQAPPNYALGLQDYISDHLARLRILYKKILESQESAATLRKRYYDKKSKAKRLKVGDKCFLKVEATPSHLSSKLCAKWDGPYRCIELIGSTAAKIRRIFPRNPRDFEVKLVHLNKLKLAPSVLAPNGQIPAAVYALWLQEE